MQLDFDLLGMLKAGNGLIFVGSVILLAALVLAARTLTDFYRYFFRKKNLTARKIRLAPGRKSMLLLGALLLVFIGTTGILGGMTVKTYVAFTRADQVGIVECLAWNSQEQFMVVSLTKIEKGRIGKSQTFSLYGDQWEISAHILKWHPNVNLLGLHTGYRFNQIKGTYIRAKDENQKPHRAYALANGTDIIWGFLSHYGKSFPLVDAVYGNAVSRPARPGERFDIFVTTSGLTVRRRK